MTGEMQNAIVDRTKLDPAAIDDVIVGCVSQAGEQAFAFARNAVLASRLPPSVLAVTVTSIAPTSTTRRLSQLRFGRQIRGGS
jgi:acetyl-CoA acetyltransferase